MSKANSSRDVGGGKREIHQGGDVDVHVLLERSGIFSRLVPDVFLNIMSRVPLSSLSQCRWVSKSWYKLIKSPGFTKIQYEWAINNNSPWVFFWFSKQKLYLVDDQAFDKLEISATAHNIALKFPMHSQSAGYVNGLICVASDPDCYYPSSIYICNPITGEYIKIPKSPNYKIPAITAFGFDPTTNDYKVIRFINSVDEDYKVLSSEGEVYTLGSSGWRKIAVPHITDSQRCGVLLNGNLHWLSYVSYSRIISAFNVGSEKFDVIQPPPHMLQMYGTSMRLVVAEGHLCLLYYRYGKPFEIWLMKDYGVQSSWVKKYSFNSNISGWFSYGSHDLIKLKNGEFLLHFTSGLDFIGYLNPENDTLRPIKIMRHGEFGSLSRSRSCYRSVVQVGSLFSPKDVGKSRRGQGEEGITQENGGTLLC